jgi:nickel transport protein
MNMRRLVKFLLFCALALAGPPLGGWFSAGRAEAHSVYIFAYPEGAQICTNSYYGGKAKVQGGLVSMLTASGEALATARSDERGKACFEPPEPVRDLIFRVEASGGHQAEFKLPASDVETVDASESSQEPVQEAGLAATAAGGLTRDDLHRALSPIMVKLAEMESEQKSRVTLKDIIGGLGWIIGLAGAALWAAARKNTAGTGK